QFFEKNIVNRERDQTQLIFRHVHRIGGRTQKDEGHELDQRVLLHRHAQETVVPRRRSGQSYHADLIAPHVDFKFLLVVLGNLLVGLRRETHGKSVGAQLLRREAQRYFLFERVGVDGDGTSRDKIFAAVEKQRHGSALHAESLDGQ